jgi:hypothetical protein
VVQVRLGPPTQNASAIIGWGIHSHPCRNGAAPDVAELAQRGAVNDATGRLRYPGPAWIGNQVVREACRRFGRCIDWAWPQVSNGDFYQLDVTTGGCRGEGMFWYDETTRGPIMVEITE